MSTNRAAEGTQYSSAELDDEAPSRGVQVCTDWIFCRETEMCPFGSKLWIHLLFFFFLHALHVEPGPPQYYPASACTAIAFRNILTASYVA